MFERFHYIFVLYLTSFQMAKLNSDDNRGNTWNLKDLMIRGDHWVGLIRKMAVGIDRYYCPVKFAIKQNMGDEKVEFVDQETFLAYFDELTGYQA